MSVNPVSQRDRVAFFKKVDRLLLINIARLHRLKSMCEYLKNKVKEWAYGFKMIIRLNRGPER